MFHVRICFFSLFFGAEKWAEVVAPAGFHAPPVSLFSVYRISCASFERNSLVNIVCLKDHSKPIRKSGYGRMDCLARGELSFLYASVFSIYSDSFLSHFHLFPISLSPS